MAWKGPFPLCDGLLMPSERLRRLRRPFLSTSGPSAAGLSPVTAFVKEDEAGRVTLCRDPDTPPEGAPSSIGGRPPGARGGAPSPDEPPLPPPPPAAAPPCPCRPP